MKPNASTQSALVLKTFGYPILAGALANAGLFFADTEDLYVLNLQTHVVQQLVVPSNGCYSLVNGLAASGDGSRVFASTFNNGTCIPPDLRVARNAQIPTSSLNVYDGSTGNLLNQVALDNPGALALGPKGDFAWIVTSNSRKLLALTVLNLTTLQPVANYPIPSAGSLNSLAITPQGAFLYATDSERALVHVIATQSGLEVATISAGVKPNEIAISPDGVSAFVTDKGGTAVTVINTASNAVTGTIDVGASSRPVVFVGK
jgi:YVTN family beta-propeller protein